MVNNKKVVIADDNKEICKLVADYLGHYGYEVDSVHDGYDLLSYLEKNNPGIIILDLMMPHKNGLSVIGSLKNVSPYSRIIIFTGHGDYANSVYARVADRFIVKGGDLSELLKAVKELS